MISTVEVFLWGTRVGILHLEPGRPYAAFEYDRDFSQSGIELSPVRMPLSRRVYEFPELAGDVFHGVPGLIADSLPDRFGNAVIRRWLAMQGRTETEFSVIDRLCYTGSRGMGALEYVPATGPEMDPAEEVDIAEMVRFASEVLSGREHEALNAGEHPTYNQLLRLGTSAGGARAKAIIAWNEKTGEIRSGQTDVEDGFEHWLIKFDAVAGNGDYGLTDAPEYTKIEYAYYLMARESGIVMNECRLYQEGGRNHFMTKRFDRDGERKRHMQTLGAIAHISYNEPGFCSYEQAAAYMRQMGLPASDIEQFFRRMVFNILAVNQDDHVKNISFLMDRQGRWRLSPAYDVAYACDAGNRWLASHQMSVNGKRTEIRIDDLLTAGSHMDLSPRRIRRILDEVRGATGRWSEFAAKADLTEQTSHHIEKSIKNTISRAF